MGRVDEAMRRAAEERERGQQADQAEPTAVLDADEADHDFPIELGPRPSRTPRPPEPRIDVPGPADEWIDAEPTATPAEETSMPLMETVDRRLTGKIVADETMPPGCREQYRRLAAVLHHSQAVNGMKVVMIASAVAGEGKTLTATNLALTFSESYQRRVLLIDGDLRRPSVHVVFGIQSVPGLSEGLSAVEPRKLPLHQVSERLTILPAGRPTSDPMAGLTSLRVQKIIDEARQAFDWVIIDTPPVGLMTDANLLATMTDGAILVVKADSTPYTMSQRAIEAIGKDRILGAVLNRAASSAVNGYKYSYDYYYGRPEAPSRPE
jgi:capsular exopolysaccharide synthesis family protein